MVLEPKLRRIDWHPVYQWWTVQYDDGTAVNVDMDVCRNETGFDGKVDESMPFAIQAARLIRSRWDGK